MDIKIFYKRTLTNDEVKDLNPNILIKFAKLDRIQQALNSYNEDKHWEDFYIRHNNNNEDEARHDDSLTEFD